MESNINSQFHLEPEVAQGEDYTIYPVVKKKLQNEKVLYTVDLEIKQKNESATIKNVSVALYDPEGVPFTIMQNEKKLYEVSDGLGKTSTYQYIFSSGTHIGKPDELKISIKNTEHTFKIK
ncbi:MAG: hypothetical protein ABIR03_07935 [Ginsengibacter sp.]